MVRFYGDRDVVALGEHYSSHVEAMTREGLHEKSDIAAELAFRDAVIQRLAEQSVKDRGDFDACVDAVHASYWTNRAADLALAWGAVWCAQVELKRLRSLLLVDIVPLPAVGDSA